MTAATTTAAAGGAAYLYHNDEGSKRSMQFWYNVGPVFAHYRGIQWLNRDLKIMDDATADRLYEEAHEKYSDFTRDLTYRMRGFYLKQAQLMSIQDDFVPPAYMRWIKNTQDNVPSEFVGSEAKHYVAKLCKEELGLEFDDVFESWEDKPLGVASIGEVHKAVLKGSHQEVAVKILVPGIEHKFRSDIRTLKKFCEIAMPMHAPAFDEIEKQFLTEFDYTKEAANLDRARNNILKAAAGGGVTVAEQQQGVSKSESWNDRAFSVLAKLTGNDKTEVEVVVPKPYMEFCSKHMLVMEYLEGVKLVDGIRAQFKKLAPLMGKTLEELEAENKKLIAEGKFNYKDVEQEKKAQQRTRVMLALKDIYETNAARCIYNYSPLRLVYGPYEYKWTDTPIDLAPILEKLSLVQANNIFFDGEFNGDAHPGNIMLLKDGRIGLIDYGQVKLMSVDSRTKYAKLILAHSRRDEKEVARLTFDELGMVTKYKKPDICYKQSAFWNDRLTEDVMQGMNIATFLDWIQDQDPIVNLPDEYLFAARSTVMLRGMGKAFGINLIISQMWKDQATRFLATQGVQY